MAIEKAEGIVLKNHNIRETSQITTLYTREFGKLTCLVKGLRAGKSKYGSRLEIFSHNRIVFYEKQKSGLHLISQCDLIDSFNQIRMDILRVGYASYFLELLNEFTKPHDRDENLFVLLRDSLRVLDAFPSTVSVTPSIKGRCETDLVKLSSVFEVKLLKTAGLMPRLEHCVVCHNRSAEVVRFSTLLGGMLCSRCQLKDRQAKVIPKGVTSTLIYIEKEKFERLVSERFRIIPDIAKLLKVILKDFIQFHLEKELKSSQFLERVLFPQRCMTG